MSDEPKQEETKTHEEFHVSADNLMEEIKKLIHEGGVTRIIIKNKEGKVLLDIPVVAGAVGVVLMPFFAGIAAIVGLANEFTLTIERREEEPTKP